MLAEQNPCARAHREPEQCAPNFITSQAVKTDERFYDKTDF